LSIIRSERVDSGQWGIALQDREIGGQMLTRVQGTEQQRRVLRLLARYPDGCAAALMLAHGFTIDMLADLAVSGLLIIDTRREQVGGRPKVVARMQISPAGRRELGK
jgi:hypothetical protein